MSNPTTPFSWQMPTATDLVTDLPADFEVFGQAVATSMADLLGGTSGQILAKNSNTDMDFVWIANDQGDITGVTATSPLTGGGTSGAITVGIQDALTTQKGAVQLSDSTSTTSSILAATPTAVKSAFDLATAAVPKSTVTTAGDIIYATGSAAVTRLGIGTNGQVLKSNGSAPVWGSDGGKVLQVVMGSTSTQASNSTTTYAATNLTATITPTLNTSKVLAIVSQNGVFRSNGNADNAIVLRLLRTATEIAVFAGEGLQTDTAFRQGQMSFSIAYLDSPATTSATTYSTEFKNKVASASVRVQETSNCLSTLILLEIGA
jgi:hypothetical protein